MTGEQWGTFLLELNASFRGDRVVANPDDPAAAAREAVWRSDVAGAEYDEAHAALRLLRSEGTAMMPAPGEFLVALRRVAAPPVAGWLEAWPLIRRAITRSSGSQRYGEGFLREIERTVGPAAASFVASYGGHRLAQEPVEDPDHGGAVMVRLGKDYAAFVASYEDGTRVAIARRKGGPRRLDPIRSLTS